MSLFGTLATPSSVQAKQGVIASTATSMDLAVQSCGGLDAGTRASWGVFLTSVRDFTATEPGYLNAGSMNDQADQLEAQLCAWQGQLAAACPMPASASALCAANQDSSNLTTIVKYVAVAAGVVAGAYAVGKVVELLPHPLFERHASSK